MKRVHILFLFCLLILTSFQLERHHHDWENKLIGIWQYRSEEENKIKLIQLNQWDNSSGGMQFLQNGKLIVRQNSGWCGTPPISYTNYAGTWKKNGDTTIELIYPFWGGTVVEQWKIQEISDSVLVYTQIHSETIRE